MFTRISDPVLDTDLLKNWVSTNTENCTTVVELGAGFFDRLEFVHPSVEHRVGIELWAPYIANAKYHHCVKIHGDIRQYRLLLTRNHFDCALIIDVLEHLEQQDALTLIDNLQHDFRKILLMVPEGVHPQDTDVTGFGAHELQTHRSWWYSSTLEDLGFDVVQYDNFHNIAGKPLGCLFAVWNSPTVKQHHDSQ